MTSAAGMSYCDWLGRFERQKRCDVYALVSAQRPRERKTPTLRNTVGF